MLRGGTDWNITVTSATKETDRVTALATELASSARGKSRSARRPHDDVWTSPGPRGGYLQRSPHGNELGSDRAERTGGVNSRSRLRREDVSGFWQDWRVCAQIVVSIQVSETAKAGNQRFLALRLKLTTDNSSLLLRGFFVFSAGAFRSRRARSRRAQALIL